MRISFVVPGAPRTKKTSNRIVRVAGFSKVLPSKAFEEWNKIAQIYLNRVRSASPLWLRDSRGREINCRALFYRQTLIGDATGFYQALADALQEARLVENDRLIVSWDGSRLLKDAENPRIEVLLTEAAA